MSMITRCPECSTQFKVVADQLRIADGWVRCGQCSHVFDGSANLQSELEAQSPEVVPERAEWENFSYNEAAMQAALAVDEPVSELPPPSQLPDLDEALMPDASPVLGDEPESAMPVPELSLAQGSLESESMGDAQVSFVRAAQRQAFWARPALRWSLALTSLVLALGLVLQVVWYERDQIAAIEPSTLPWLQALCQPVGCSMAPLKRIDAISVDSSAFNRVRGDVYRLQVTLKSSASTELALPALELTLTDLHDEPVLRRVLLPAEFAAGVVTIAAGAELPSSMTVSVVGTSRIAGYRVLAFYP